MTTEYYLQDSRSFLGNSLVFWRKGGGYSSHIDEAEIFTSEEAWNQNQSRSTDIPWPKEYIDKRLSMCVDSQRCNLEDALKSDFLKLRKEKVHPKLVHKCGMCGRFINEIQVFAGCPNCFRRTL